MPDKPAARQTDKVTCPITISPPTPPIFHDPSKMGNPISINTSLNVSMDNLNAACVGAMSVCCGPPPNDPIISGAMGVLINNKPPAREGEFGAHPGSKIAGGSGTVLIGGPSCCGNPTLGKEDCEKAAQGRASNSTAQSYGNCGIEACRQIINRTNNSSVTEDGLKNWATSPTQNLATATGGTNYAQRRSILTANGVGSTPMAQTLPNLIDSLKEGKGVIAALYTSKYRPAAEVIARGRVPGSNTGPHAILITGAKLDQNGNVVSIICNDTSANNNRCGYEIPAGVFAAAFIPTSNLNVTNAPIW